MMMAVTMMVVAGGSRVGVRLPISVIGWRAGEHVGASENSGASHKDVSYVVLTCWSVCLPYLSMKH